MHKMKDSGIEWIGEIPEHWTFTKVSIIFKKHKCLNIGMKEKNLLSLSYGKIIRKDINSNEGLLPESFETYNIIEEGNIIFRLTDLQNDKRSLRTGICKERGIITSAYITLELRTEDNPSYMHYLFHAYDVCKVFYTMGNGVRQSITYTELRKLLILRPPLDEQNKIAAYLDRKCTMIDELITKNKRLIELLKIYKKSMITEAVTKGLDRNVVMKDSGVEWIGEIPAHWTLTKFKYVLNITGGNGFKEKYQGQKQGDYPFCKVSDINSDDKYLSTANNYVDEELVQEEKYRVIPKNSILIAKIGEALKKNHRKINLVPCIIDNNLEAFSLKSTGDIDFLYYVLKIVNMDWFNNYGTIPCVNNVRLKSLKLPLPPLNEQKKIAAHLDKNCAILDKEISIRQQLVEKFIQYKKSLIYEVVTGKLEV